MRLGMSIVIAMLLAAGCDKGDQSSSAERGRANAPVVDPASLGTTGPDGIRRVQVQAGKSGYLPDKIVATPGEKLILVFTRTTEARCLAQVKVAGGELVELPVGQPVEVPVTAPADKGATIRFACGMDMMTGLIAVN